MALLTVIGRGVRIRGRILGEGDLTIEGHVEGEVAVSGEVTVEAAGLVGANVSARVVIVRGAVRGDLTGEDAVRLEEGARVVGDISAPRISIARGGLVRGLVQTNGSETTLPRAKPHAAAAKPAPAVAARKPVVAVQPAAPAPVRPVAIAQKPAAAPASRAVSAPGAPRAAAPVVQQYAAPKGPPPPVVPALKKGAKGALKKKAQ